VTSLLAFVGAVTCSFSDTRMREIMPTVIACVVGVLVGEACLHLIPEAARSGTGPTTLVIGVLLGATALAIMELGLRRLERGPLEIAPVGRLALVAESLHNAIDGALIAGGYMAGVHVGLVVTVAVILHEVPHELGNFGVLVHAGYPRRKALLFNFLSACFAFIGALAMLALGATAAGFANAALPVAAGSFLYLALADLLPDLIRGTNLRQRTTSGFAAVAGVAFMAAILRFT
jgi:zinc and cadmium transporter